MDRKSRRQGDLLCCGWWLSRSTSRTPVSFSFSSVGQVFRSPCLRAFVVPAWPCPCCHCSYSEPKCYPRENKSPFPLALVVPVHVTPGTRHALLRWDKLVSNKRTQEGGPGRSGASMFCVSAKAAKGRQRHTSEGSRQQAMAAVTAQPSTPQLQPNNSAAGLFCPTLSVLFLLRFFSKHYFATFAE